jgi:ribonuclease HII
VAAALVLCKPSVGERLTGIDDSKKLSAKRRAVLEPIIRETCAFGIGVVEAAEIDELNIFAATMLAMTRATALLEKALQDKRFGALEGAIIDGNMTPVGRSEGWHWPARAIVGGDGLEPAISAASILAKEHRDRVMREAAARYPHYGWERNMGYGTKEHMAALQEHGPCDLHRRSFAPVARAADAKMQDK